MTEKIKPFVALLEKKTPLRELVRVDVTKHAAKVPDIFFFPSMDHDKQFSKASKDLRKLFFFVKLYEPQVYMEYAELTGESMRSFDTSVFQAVYRFKRQDKNKLLDALYSNLNAYTSENADALFALSMRDKRVFKVICKFLKSPKLENRVLHVLGSIFMFNAYNINPRGEVHVVKQKFVEEIYPAVKAFLSSGYPAIRKEWKDAEADDEKMVRELYTSWVMHGRGYDELSKFPYDREHIQTYLTFYLYQLGNRVSGTISDFWKLASDMHALTFLLTSSGVAEWDKFSLQEHEDLEPYARRFVSLEDTSLKRYCNNPRRLARFVSNVAELYKDSDRLDDMLRLLAKKVLKVLETTDHADQLLKRDRKGVYYLKHTLALLDVCLTPDVKTNTFASKEYSKDEKRLVTATAIYRFLPLVLQ